MTKLRKFRCSYLITQSLEKHDQLTNFDLSLILETKDRTSIIKKATKLAKDNEWVLTSIEEI